MKMNIDQTSREITKRMNIIEKKINDKLLIFYEKEIQPFSTISPSESIRRIHEDKIKTIIRKAVEESYLTGTDIVGNAIKEKRDFELFTSRTDINNIIELTDHLNEDFWNTVSRLVQRETEYIVNKDQELEKKKSFDTEAAITSISSFIAFRSFNTGVRSKVSNIRNNLTVTVGMAGARASDVIVTGLADIEIPPIEIEPEPLVMFLTAEDEKVCTPETNTFAPCSPWNRTEWNPIEDILEMPLPPLHRYCRCQLVPLI